jgi:hypothetical protein
LNRGEAPGLLLKRLHGRSITDEALWKAERRLG